MDFISRALAGDKVGAGLVPARIAEGNDRIQLLINSIIIYSGRDKPAPRVAHPQPSPLHSYY